MTPDVTYFTVSDRRYFTGVVGLVNSLRVTGNPGQVLVLDAGLDPWQRELLATRCRVVDPGAAVSNPLLLKPFPAVLGPEGVVVVIDSDVIVTGSLAPLVDRAAKGAIVVVHDMDATRWFAEWEDLLRLAGPPRRQRYASSGFVALSTEHWPGLLRRWWDTAALIPAGATMGGGASYDTPLADGDQDAFNAILMTEVPEDALVRLDHVVAPLWPDMLRETRVLDARTLRCRRQGSDTLLLHHGGAIKPWDPLAWARCRQNAYTVLLPGLLAGEGLALSVPTRRIPPALRPGRPWRWLARALDAANAAAHVVLDHVPVGLRARLRRAARAISARGRR